MTPNAAGRYPSAKMASAGARPARDDYVAIVTRLEKGRYAIAFRMKQQLEPRAATAI
jgi:hypothetical protein